MSGLESNYICQRLLENKKLDLATACQIVLTLEKTEK